MKKTSANLLSAFFLLILANCLFAQTPVERWKDLYPLEYEQGNYTANDLKESPYLGSYVLVGSRSMTWKGNGYNQVLVMRVDDEGGSIRMNQVFTGYHTERIFDGTVMVLDTIPWDQVAYDMMFVKEEDLRYLITGYRDTTLLTPDTPPGLFLMEVRGDGRVAYDSLYYNHTMHHMTGYSIQPAIGGGCIIAGSIREDGAGPDKILVTRMMKNEDGIYEPPDIPAFKVIEAGEGGYARWVRQFGNGYLLAGNAYNGTEKQFDIFLQKLYPDLGADWLSFYGKEKMDEFSDALVTRDHIYLAGSMEVPVPGTSYYNYQIYVAKLDTLGKVIWEQTYGGPTRHFANKVMQTANGDLVVAGTAYDQSMHTHMLLLGIDNETGDSLWMQSYGTNYTNSGIRDAIYTSGFDHLVAGRASSTTMQDPRVFLMSLNYPDRLGSLLAREELNLDLMTGTPVKDVIEVSADKNILYGVQVTIDSLLHPSVGDLELTLEHAGTTVTLVDKPRNSGANFVHTGLKDGAERTLDLAFAPYTGWYLPEEPLSPFRLHPAAGEWTLTVTDHGTGGLKTSTRVLEGWSLNLLVESGGGTGRANRESLSSFGLEQIRPNPVGELALIRFRLPDPGPASLKVYNQLGQIVARLADSEFPEGVHELAWYPGSLPAGAYFIQLESAGRMSVRKALLNR